MTGVALLPVVMLFASSVNLLTQVLIPQFLAPAEYAAFSTTWAYGQVVSVLFFEWLRLSVLRFSEGADAVAVAVRRRTMASSLLGITALLLGMSALAFVLHETLSVPAWIAAVAFYACCQGVFDSVQARRRAASLHTRFITILSIRSLLSLLLAAGIAAVTQSGLATLLALALSYPASLLLDLRRVPTHVRAARYDRDSLHFLIRFGAFMATANALGLLFPALLRLQANLYLPAAAAGGIVLAFDYLQRVVGLAGLAVNIIVSQRSFRSAEFDSADKQLDQVKMQLFAPAFLILTGAAAVVVLLHGIGAALVPPAYASSFDAALPHAAIASALIAVRMYSLDPLFVMAARTRTAIYGPAATLLTGAAAAALLVNRGVNPIDALGMSASASAIIGLSMSFAVLRRSVILPPTAVSILLLLVCIGGGLSLALAVPDMPVWADAPIRLMVLCIVALVAPVVIFRSELSAGLTALRASRI